jgi:hypothetical protein
MLGAWNASLPLFKLEFPERYALTLAHVNFIPQESSHYSTGIGNARASVSVGIRIGPPRLTRLTTEIWE